VPPTFLRRPASRLTRLLLLSAGVYGVAQLLASVTGWAPLELFARLAAGCLGLLLLAWLARAAWRHLFWSVGRRLAFSYILVGVLPLVLIATLGLLCSYLLGGFLLGHLYRDAIDDLRDELESAALARLHEAPSAHDRAVAVGWLHFADYRRGHKIDGGAEAPQEWPAWLAAAQAQRDDPTNPESRRPFVALSDGSLSAAAIAGDAERGALVWYRGDLAAFLRERTKTWFELYRSDDPRKLPVTRIQIGARVLTLRGLWLHREPQELEEFYRLNPPEEAGSPRLIERPVILWMERAGILRSLANGETAADGVAVSLAASPRGLFRALLSTSEQADSSAWLALAGVSVLLFEIWAVAAAVAIFMIYGLSRAVNRLSRATEAIGRGDFSFRIPGRRRDQLGELQRSFNEMAAHLGELVGTAAQKEALDKELALARQVQQDLLPESVGDRSGVDIAAHFEPSAAIGGDYYDILDRPGGGFAIVVADVAGHGLAAGLRMAMVKSALTLLVEEGRSAQEVFQRLGHLLRRRAGERSFVTLALADFDPAGGRLELLNAGHPPAYLVRASGEVVELMLPGVPLGGLSGAPGHASLRLAPGEGVVFLSDGLIEARNPEGELFGYEAVRARLAGEPTDAAGLLDRLLAAVREFSAGAPAEDDRTVVAVVYRAATPPTERPSSE
jgi:serine phosphatase RsbU (regulator of sigma subunit)